DDEDTNFTADNNESVSVADDDSLDSAIDSNNSDTSDTYTRKISKWAEQCTSVVWDFFTKEKNDNQEVIAIVCDLCKQKWKLANTTGTFTIHLNNKHHKNIFLKQQTLSCLNSKAHIFTVYSI
ncbi:13921_t:CDS:1, partial [Cetraspora pellucida]